MGLLWLKGSFCDSRFAPGRRVEARHRESCSGVHLEGAPCASTVVSTCVLAVLAGRTGPHGDAMRASPQLRPAR